MIVHDLVATKGVGKLSMLQKNEQVNCHRNDIFLDSIEKFLIHFRLI